ncbi:MAG TPA: hypothetical protein VFQ30_00360, partial [Ktedonobacteraceae bacterium]|nr:hypothetical protein [Ktedonobacteraceae bacterium]
MRIDTDAAIGCLTDHNSIYSSSHHAHTGLFDLDLNKHTAKREYRLTHSILTERLFDRLKTDTILEEHVVDDENFHLSATYRS